MELQIYWCDGEAYSADYEICVIKHQTLYFKDQKIEIELTSKLSQKVIGQSDGRFNVMFKDDNDELPENERLYFTKVGWYKKYRLQQMFVKLWIQQDNNWLKILTAIGIIAGITMGSIKLLTEE